MCGADLVQLNTAGAQRFLVVRPCMDYNEGYSHHAYYSIFIDLIL